MTKENQMHIKYVGGQGPLELPGQVLAEQDKPIDVPDELGKELVARGDFEKVTEKAGGKPAGKDSD